MILVKALVTTAVALEKMDPEKLLDQKFDLQPVHFRKSNSFKIK